MTWEVEYTDELGTWWAEQDRWYDNFVPVADTLYDEHLVELKKGDGNG
jgi:hypothetical protein